MGSDIGTDKASLHTINARAGEGWDPFIKFHQFNEDLVFSFSTAADFYSKLKMTSSILLSLGLFSTLAPLPFQVPQF